jgi:twitching motility protein PilI
MPPPPLTPVPLTKNWYCGVANVRGNLYSIIDLNTYTRQEATARDAHNRVMLLGQRFAFNTGLLVTRVLGLRNTEDWPQSEENGSTSYQDPSGQIWHKLDIHQLLSQPEFLQIGE